MAGVSVSWYTWLEQARPINASRDVLDALARALQLSPAETAHLLALADRAPRPPLTEPETAPESLVRLIESVDPSPAYVLGPRWEFLAWNRAQARLFAESERLDRADRNLLYVMFASPTVREMVIDWPAESRRLLRQFRADTDRVHGDAQLDALVARLDETSPEFACAWAAHEVGPFESRLRSYRHPRAGLVTFEYQQLIPAEFPSLRVVVHLAIAGDDSVARLAAWHEV